MTDNRTTELRWKLAERGVEYDVKDLPNIKFFHDTRWNANGVRWCYTEFVGATTCLTMCNEWKDCTPEQAIAATLGKPKAKSHPYGYERDTGAYDCTRCECGCINDISATYCHNCGAKVVSA